MTETAVTDWNDAYMNGAYIANADSYPPMWQADASAFRNSWADKELDIAYGQSERQRMDLFLPEARPAGMVVFVHGGYWHKFDKSYWSDRAAGALALGWAVCLPSYDLCPDVNITQITSQIGAAITAAAQKVGGPIRLSGHSAGGHLVTRMICNDTPLPQEILDRIEKVVSISGLHDLSPLLMTDMNKIFSMDAAEAERESAALREKATDCPVVAWVGGAERPEFIRQSRLLSETWSNTVFIEEAGKHHFDVIDGLKTADGALTRALLDV